MKSSSLSHTKTKGNTSSVVGLVVFSICLIVAGWLFINRVYVIDQLTVWQFEPSRAVQTITERAELSDRGRFYFYASKPEVDEASVFNQQCKKQEEHSAILGCYAARRIFIYNVANAQLDGIKEVTAAHELLHAAWDRLDKAEKERLGALLDKAYTKIGTDELEERMAYYARTQPGERANELHSIVGTETADLGEELEAYYAQYFTDRQQIVTFHQNYASLFTQIEQRAKAVEAEMATLTSQIESGSASYNAGVSQLNADITSFNSRAQNDGFNSITAFYAERNALISRSDSLEAQRNEINQQVASYNTLRAELESLSAESEALNRSIDSSLAPAPSAI